MIYQKTKGPTKVLFARISADTYALIIRLAGEDSLPLFLEKTFGRKTASTNCNLPKTNHTIGANTYVR